MKLDTKTGMLLALIVFCLTPATPAAAAGSYDSAPAWPLCGRITENPPAGWVESDGCPSTRWGSSAYSDEPISDTFGPRLLGTAHDFHRGLDIDTPWDTPVFAMAAGEVKKISSGSTNITLTLRHWPAGYTKCGAAGGCYHTRYVHLSSVVSGLEKGDEVDKGQLIGYTGASSATATPHLHFEVRDAPSQDPYSYWQRDCIHPLAVLPYADAGAANMSLDVAVDDTSPTNPLVTVEVSMPVEVELDLNRVEVTVYENTAGLVEVAQTAHVTTGTTPETTPYDVDPPWFDMQVWNRQYTYKDSSSSSSIPYSDFETGGAYESPYASDPGFPTGYDAGYHLDAATASDPSIGDFNGALIAPENLTSSSTHYVVAFAFTELAGPSDADDLCVEATATDVLGNSTSTLAGNCS